MRGRTALVGLVISLVAALPAHAQAQHGGFVGVWGGATTDADNSGAGTDFAVGLQAGFAWPHLGIGVDLGQQRTGNTDKSDLLGLFVRVQTGLGPLHPYATGGIGLYRFAPQGLFNDSKGGASVGLGVLTPLGFLKGAQIGVEGRYHSVFNTSPGLPSQRFVTILLGLQLNP